MKKPPIKKPSRDDKQKQLNSLLVDLALTKKEDPLIKKLQAEINYFDFGIQF
jgi:hypothetical protein